jgi:two-component system NtrC family sensor kinase
VIAVASTIDIEAFYRIFRDISTSVHSCSDVKEVLDLVVRKSSEVVNAKGAILRILNLETSQLDLSAAYGLSEEYLSKGHISSKNRLYALYRFNKVFVIKDVQKDPRVIYREAARREGIRMMLDLPLTIENNFIGIIRIFFAQPRDFSEEELSFLVSIAEQCALALEKARLIEKQKLQYMHLSLQTEKMAALGRMAAAIAHEINNPLAGVLLFSTNLAKKVPKEGPLKEGLDIIIHETIRCKSIIQELLEFSREREPQKVLKNINDVINKALSILENEFRLHHISTEKALSDELPDTLLDVNQMEQVFVNLLLNAVEAIQEKGVITIKSYLDASQAYEIIDIMDTGCGIPPDDMNKIFEPFFSTKPKGTGLGLAVSYGIVRNHQGEIKVSSQPGSGTRFTIEIPVTRETSSVKV